MISIIIPVYNEEKNLPVLQAELGRELTLIGPHEIIYVNDGSTDGSADALVRIRNDYSNVRVIEFARHFGQTEAMQAGIDHASGDIVVFLDADLQNDPKDIPKLLDKMKEGYDVVSGWRKDRKDPFLTRRIPSMAANFIITRMAKVRIHDLGCTLKAYRKEVIQGVRLYSEMHRLIVVLALRQGASIAEVEVAHRKRVAGRSKYGLMRFFRVVLDLYVTEFMNTSLSKPMYVFGGHGICLMMLSSVLGSIIIIRKIFFGGEWVSPLLFIFILCVIISAQFFLMGLIAEIMVRVYYEREDKKTYLVRKVL